MLAMAHIMQPHAGVWKRKNQMQIAQHGKLYDAAAKFSPRILFREETGFFEMPT